MKDDLIKTFLYQEVMKLAFEVTDKSKINRWICVCVGSFGKFWGVGYSPCTNTRSPLTLNVDEFDMFCEISFSALDDFTVIINTVADRAKELILRHEVHSSLQQDFIIPHSFTKDQRASARKKYTTEQLGLVIDYLLLHPFVHFHLKGPVMPKNNIRLGGGISNILQYLFHLRYQLCPEAIRHPKATGASRHPARDRLITLFYNAIESDRTAISSAELMKVPK
jgi:hypothetical protein